MVPQTCSGKLASFPHHSFLRRRQLYKPLLSMMLQVINTHANGCLPSPSELGLRQQRRLSLSTLDKGM